MVTGNQEAFAQAIVGGANQTEAYRLAGYSVDQAPETLWSHASALASNDKVVARIRELRDSVTATVVAKRAWDLDKIVDEFEINVNLGRTLNNQGSPTALSASNGAITGIGKALGLLTDKVDVNVTHTIKPGLTLEELESRYQRLEALESGIVETSGRIVPNGEGEDGVSAS